MPPFVRFLSGLFFAIPGVLLWFFGLVTLFFVGWHFPGRYLGGGGYSGEALATIVSSVAVVLMTVFGYSMLAIHDLLITKARYHLPAKRIFPCIFSEIVVQMMGAVSFGFTLGTLPCFGDREANSPWLVALFFSGGFLSSIAVVYLIRALQRQREGWKAEAAAALPTIPDTSRAQHDTTGEP